MPGYLAQRSPDRRHVRLKPHPPCLQERRWCAFAREVVPQSGPPRKTSAEGPAEAYRAYFMHKLPQSAGGVAGGEASCDNCDGHWAALLGSCDCSNTLRRRVECDYFDEGRKLRTDRALRGQGRRREGVRPTICFWPRG